MEEPRGHDPEAVVRAAERQRELPDEGESDEMGKVGRLRFHTRSLVDDAKEWVDLRMRLTQIEIEERLDRRVNQALSGAIVLALLYLALAFGLTAAALGIGTWLGHPGWGFAVVCGFLLVVTVIVAVAKPRFVDVRNRKSPSDGSNG